MWIPLGLGLVLGCGPAVDSDTDAPPMGSTGPVATDSADWGDSMDTESPGTVGPGSAVTSDPGASTGGSPDVELGPCAQISGCLAEQGLTNEMLIDRYGPNGTCWEEFPAPTCWIQCAAWLETVTDNCTVESPACCACGSDFDCTYDPSAPTCDNGRCVAGGAPGCDAISFAADVQPILDSICIECHTPGGPWPSLDMTVDAYDDLVNADGIQTLALRDIFLVVPGDPESSYILYKLAGTQETIAGAAAGSQMPQGFDPLPLEQQETIRSWIECGAPR